jgi:hypothetical protein
MTIDEQLNAMIKDLKDLGVGFVSDDAVELAVPALQAAEFIVDLRNKIDSYGLGDADCFHASAVKTP